MRRRPANSKCSRNTVLPQVVAEITLLFGGNPLDIGRFYLLPIGLGPPLEHDRLIVLERSEPEASSTTL